MSQRHVNFLAAMIVLAVAGQVIAAETKSKSRTKTGGVSITPQGQVLRVEVGGQLFTEYHYQNVPRPYFYPLLGPAGLGMTRNYPTKDVAGEDRDHIHHRSLWFTHGEINGVDFWSENDKAGKVVHEKFLERRSGKDIGVIRSSNQYVAPDGKIICTDERTFRVFARPGCRLFDFEVTLHASNGEVVLGDTKEGSMAIRLAESMRLTHGKKTGDGHIVNSNGLRDGDTWGKRAEWVDYYGPVEGKTVGVAIFDHPKNPMHPTWWHVRDYGLFAANPFGVHDFEKKPKGTGNYTIPAGKSATFRYRFFIHDGDEKQGDVAARYREYVAGSKTK